MKKLIILFLAGTIVLCGSPINGYAQTRVDRVVTYRSGRAIYYNNGRVRLQPGINNRPIYSNGGNSFYGNRRGYLRGNTTRRTGTQTPGENGRAHSTKRTGRNSPFR